MPENMLPQRVKLVNHCVEYFSICISKICVYRERGYHEIALFNFFIIEM